MEGCMKQVESYTVEEVEKRVLSKTVTIAVSSKMLEDGCDKFGKPQFRVAPLVISVAHERDMKPELVLSGPNQRGEVNVYIGVDGRKHYFDAKTGVALGSQLLPKGRTQNFIKPIPPSKSDPAPEGTNQSYIR